MELAKGCDILIHMNHYFSGTEPTPAYRAACGNHRDNAIIAKRAGVKTLVLTHLLAQIDQPGIREQIVHEIQQVFEGKRDLGRRSDAARSRGLASIHNRNAAKAEAFISPRRCCMARTASSAAIALSRGFGEAWRSSHRPDFSGRWTANPSPQRRPPPRGSVPPTRGDMGSGWGSPLTITQDAGQLVVEQTLFSRYDLQPPIRFVYVLDGSETRNAVMIGHTTQVRLSRAAWEGQTLRITTMYPSIDPASGKPFTTEVTHRLSLESPTVARCRSHPRAPRSADRRRRRGRCTEELIFRLKAEAAAGALPPKGRKLKSV